MAFSMYVLKTEITIYIIFAIGLGIAIYAVINLIQLQRRAHPLEKAIAQLNKNLRALRKKHHPNQNLSP